MSKIFAVIGNFGVGKTSVLSYYNHKKTDEPYFTDCEGFLMLGGKHGADSMGKYYPKNYTLDVILPAKKDRSIVIHSMFYNGVKDLIAYKKTHEPHLIYLKTSFETNVRRMHGRSKNVPDAQDYNAFERSTEKLIFACKNLLDIPVVTVDNNRELSVVAQEVWDYIKSA